MLQSKLHKWPEAQNRFGVPSFAKIENPNKAPLQFETLDPGLWDMFVCECDVDVDVFSPIINHNWGFQLIAILASKVALWAIIGPMLNWFLMQLIQNIGIIVDVFLNYISTFPKSSPSFSHLKAFSLDWVTFHKIG